MAKVLSPSSSAPSAPTVSSNNSSARGELEAPLVGLRYVPCVYTPTEAGADFTDIFDCVRKRSVLGIKYIAVNQTTAIDIEKREPGSQVGVPDDE
jgi:hypothetical protein